MKIHEYQAAEILKSNGIPVPIGYMIDNLDEVKATVETIQKESNNAAVVVKAQIHAGGRGKGGGVKFSPDLNSAVDNAKSILGMQLITPQTSGEGQTVRKLYITQAIDIAREYYLAITLDRSSSQPIIIASAEGGMEIEELAHSSPEKIIKERIDPIFGLQPFQSYRISASLGLTGHALKEACKVISDLYKSYVNSDVSLAEINPLVLTKDDRIFALDAKFNFDDNALFRQQNINTMRDIFEEDPADVEASKFNLNYIKLDGNVGCMVNGAGLAMAAMDIIKLKGGEPANFLDVGGGANVETVKNGFRIILSDKNVTAVLINIFGGIVRCDRVANGIVEAVKVLDLNVPVVVRLEGTNATEAKEILASSGVAIIPASSLDEAAEKTVEVAISK